MKILMLFVLLYSPLSYCDSLYTGAWSEHFAGEYKEKMVNGGKTRRWEKVINNEHNLLAYEHNSYIVGYFKNSFDGDTLVVGKRYNIWEGSDFKAGFYAGATYGYKSCTGLATPGDSATWCPAIVPELSYTKYKLQPTLLILGGAVAISVKWDI